VGTPAWVGKFAEWNASVWPVLVELSGARPTVAAAARHAAERAAAGALTSADSSTAMQRSLHGDYAAAVTGAAPAAAKASSASSIMRLMSAGSRRWAISGRGQTPVPAGRSGTQPQAFLAPTILTNAVGLATAEARVRACLELQPPGSPKRTRHVEISLPPGVSYRAGDHIGVCPKNDEDQVERLALRLGSALDGLFMVPKTMNVRVVPKGAVLQVRNVLANLVDIGGRPTVPLLDLLLGKAADPADWSRLAEIRDVLRTPDGPASPLRAVIDAGGYGVLSLLDEFGSCRLNIFEFLQVAQPLRPRYYSASSSPRIHGDGIAHLTVGLETVPAASLSGRDFRGMASSYVHALREGDRLTVFGDSADGFHLQQDVTKPMIFVSAGTGFAPMRAFLWERLAMKNAGLQLAEAALFNGIRSSLLDFLYRDEIERFTAEGVLDHLHIAASRESPGRREHVQDRIREQGALVWRLLASGGYVYVCGSQPMRAAVRAAFVDVVAEHGSQPRERAEAHVGEMETTARYRPDLWG
jgi:cytochrome P450/NADPH-cytochrome P450 reductase